VLLVGPAGVGKTFMAQALGYTAIRAGYTVRFCHADDFFRAMTQARVDNSVDRAFRSFLTPDLLILDDRGLHGLTAQQSADLYELILNRHRASSFVITSNRAVDEWLSLFDDPILGNSKPMPVVRAVQMRLTHIWPRGCKLTVSRVVRTEADQ
jgi:DNA replication protein DnaC